MATFYLTSNSSDLSGGSDFSNVLSKTTESLGTISIGVSNSATETSYAWTNTGLLSGWNWNGGGTTHTVEINVTTANSSILASVRLDRVNSSGTVIESSSTTAEQSCGTTGVKTFTITKTWGTTGNSDRLRVSYIFRSSQTMGGTASIAIQTGGTNSEVITPIVSAPPSVYKLYQHDNSYNALPTGSSQNSGTNNKVWLSADVKHGEIGANITTNIESRLVGTAFSDTANITPAVNTSTVNFGSNSNPTIFRSHSVVYDSVRQRVIQFGGWDGSNNTNNTYELKIPVNGSPTKPMWRQLSPSGTLPPAVRLHGAVFDHARNRMVVFGGYTTTDSNAVYSLDFSSSEEGSWSQLTPSGTAPAARANIGEMMPFVPSTNTAYVFGGWGASHTNDLFALNLTTASGAWTTLKANGASGNPIGRRDGLMRYDAQNNRLVLFGGYTGSVPLNDTWGYNLSNNTWTQLTDQLVDTLPPTRYLHVGQVDPVNNRLLMLAGYQGSVATLHRDAWSFDLSGNTKWTNITPPSSYELPHPTYAASSCYDSNNKLMLWNGGVDTTNDMQRMFNAIDVTDTSTNLTVYGLSYNSVKRALDAPGLVVNWQDNEILSIGGYGNMIDDTTISTGEHLSDVYLTERTSASQVNWRNALRGVLSFHNREGVLSAWDSTRKRALVFGGLKGIDGTYNDLWELRRGSDGLYSAKKLKPTGTRPGQRWLGVAGYDAVNDRLIIYTGEDGASTLMSDMWACSFASSDDGAWSQVTPSGTSPTPVWGPSYSQDYVNNTLYMFGGSTSASDGPYSNQFFRLNLSTLSWTSLSTSPSARRSSGLAVQMNNAQTAAENVYLFGGHTGSVQNDGYIYSISSNSWTTLSYSPFSELPPARRSHSMWAIPQSLDGYFVVADGRPASGKWFNDSYLYNGADSMIYSTLHNYYLRFKMAHNATTVNEGSYHWQAWAAEGLNSGTKVSYGGNLESDIDYIIGAGFQPAVGYKKILVNGIWTVKPVKFLANGTWAQKQVKIKSGGTWSPSVE